MSPVIYNAAFAHRGIDAVFVAMPVEQGSAVAAVAAMRTMSLMGFSVTMPHKAAVMAACDQITERAQRLQAVNCVHWHPEHDDVIVGDNTDGAGFIAGLQAEMGVDPADATCVVLGAGGAARAVILALAEAGAARVTVVNRSQERAAEAAKLAGSVGATGQIDAVATADIIVNGTPLGMAGTAHATSIPFDPAIVRADAVVSDLIYHPLETPLLAACKQRGLRAQNGVSMLVHQAVVQYENFTGQPAPTEVMAQAVRALIEG